jgi:3-oxoadipate enol-lactonase
MRFFARRHRCITYSFRGYPGSDVPADPATMYGQQHAVDDARHMLDHLGIARAHVVGLSQGAFATAHFGRLLCRPCAVAHAGRRRLRRGAVRATSSSRRTPVTTAGRASGKHGMAKYAEGLTTNPTRSRFRHEGSARLRRIRDSTCPSIPTSARPTPWRTTRASGRRSTTSKTEWQRLDVPTLILCGDEDDPCLQPSLYLTRVLPNAGLAMFAKTGHTVNLEEPDAFNRELAGTSSPWSRPAKWTATAAGRRGREPDLTLV